MTSAEPSLVTDDDGGSGSSGGQSSSNDGDACENESRPSFHASPSARTPRPRSSASSASRGCGELSLFTLNCWGLKWISKDKSVRFAAIAAYLREANKDVVFLQEVWCRRDYEYLQAQLHPVLPHSFHFKAGCVGTGLCIFSRIKLHNFLYIPFQPNGFYYRVGTADWYAGKGLAVAQGRFQHYKISFVTTHTHVETSTNEYVAHRVAQASLIADTLQALGGPRTITLLAGDLNSSPEGPLISVLRSLLPDLRDCWQDADEHYIHPSLSGGRNTECGGQSDAVGGPSSAQTPANGSKASDSHSAVAAASGAGATCNVPSNSYCPPSKADFLPSRLDYIFYRLCSRSVAAQVLSCATPLPSRIPPEFGKNCSYSDHEAVSTVIRFLPVTEEALLHQGTFSLHYSPEKPRRPSTASEPIAKDTTSLPRPLPFPWANRLVQRYAGDLNGEYYHRQNSARQQSDENTSHPLPEGLRHLNVSPSTEATERSGSNARSKSIGMAPAAAAVVSAATAPVAAVATAIIRRAPTRLRSKQFEAPFDGGLSAERFSAPNKERALEVMQSSLREVDAARRKMTLRFRWSTALGVFLLLLLASTIYVPDALARKALYRVIHNIVAIIISMLAFTFLFVHPITTHSQFMALSQAKQCIAHRCNTLSDTPRKLRKRHSEVSAPP